MHNDAGWGTAQGCGLINRALHHGERRACKPRPYAVLTVFCMLRALRVDLLRIRVNDEQHTALQGDAGGIAYEDVAHAAWSPKMQRLTGEGIVQARRAYARSVARQRQQGEQVARLTLDICAPRTP